MRKVVIGVLLAIGFAFGGTIAHAQEYGDQGKTFAERSQTLCDQQSRAKNGGIIGGWRYKKWPKARPVPECLQDHQNVASVCAEADNDQVEAYIARRKHSRKLMVGCRHALQRIQAKYGEYNENIPDDMIALAYRNYNEKKLDFILGYKRISLEALARNFNWCTKLFGKRQRQCHKNWQNYLKALGSQKMAVIEERFARKILAITKEYTGSY